MKFTTNAQFRPQLMIKYNNSNPNPDYRLLNRVWCHQDSRALELCSFCVDYLLVDDRRASSACFTRCIVRYVDAVGPACLVGRLDKPYGGHINKCSVSMMFVVSKIRIDC